MELKQLFGWWGFGVILLGYTLLFDHTVYNKELNFEGEKVYYNTKKDFDEYFDLYGFPNQWDMKEVKKNGTEIEYKISPKLYNNPKLDDSFYLEKFAINKKFDGEKGYLFGNITNKRSHELVRKLSFFNDSTKEARNKFFLKNGK